MKISIIIPVYNEEKRVIGSLHEIYKYMAGKDYELILVNDGSKDNTLNELKKIKNKRTRIISYSENKGKGYAVKTGMLAAKGDLLFLTDSDLSAPINEFSKLTKEINKYDIVIGSRALAQSKIKTKWYRKLLGRIGNFFISILAVKGINDTQCGFKLFKNKSKELFRKQKINRWGFDFEILSLAQKKGYKIKEVPIKWHNVEGSKLKAFDYLKTLIELIKLKIRTG